MPGLAPEPDHEFVATVTPLRRRTGRVGTVSTDQGTAAEFWEQIYTQQGRTLKDIGTADPHRIALATFALLLDGAEAAGEVAADAATYLRGLLIEGIQAPDQL
ncbi:hypothetical protein ACIF6L_34920 [Kitasatospora sp. NPDC086009]|uniref:hypothetical protein n=1 Tax=unclassified Kitasatospora TaxID=2633591 RepID=UPI0037C6FAA3